MLRAVMDSMPGQCRCVPCARGAGLAPSSTTGSLQCSKNHAKELTPKPQDCPATQVSSEPVPAMSHIPLAKVSLNTLCCSVLKELEVFRVQQFELHPTKDMVKKPHLYPLAS